MKYIVIYPSSSLPEDFRVPKEYNGYWYNRNELPIQVDKIMFSNLEGTILCYAYPTDKIESRDDGEMAEVWEIRQ